ncbi:hypothetical protein J2S71_000904 [Olsenella profusa DSM 13989]|uniref:hypothetical protein n=1 Tax=Olsenella profusa TaxID=138595 RepID=UPI00278AEAEC|nr:hypothetical protein [Olsenella profusa]MDP9859208.1 hypothetical protein [Olsenella profusa DSM 13989]
MSGSVALGGAEVAIPDGTTVRPLPAGAGVGVVMEGGGWSVMAVLSTASVTPPELLALIEAAIGSREGGVEWGQALGPDADGMSGVSAECSLPEGVRGIAQVTPAPEGLLVLFGRMGPGSGDGAVRAVRSVLESVPPGVRRG